MLTRGEKAEVVGELADKFKRQRVSIFTDIRGIGVAKLSAFRRELKKAGAEIQVAKKTLLKRALEAVGPAWGGSIEPKALDGEIGVIFGYEDQVAPVKAAAKFAKDNETFKVLTGALAGRILEAGEVLALARLPSHHELVGRLAYVLNAPIQGLVIALQGNLRNLVGVLKQVKSKR